MRLVRCVPVLLTGCHPTAVVSPDSGSDADSDVDADTDGDTDADSDADVDTLSLDADFDSGSIGAYSINGDTLRMAVDQVTMVNTGAVYAYWTHFELSGVGDREITVEVHGVHDNPFFGELHQDVQMVYSCDGETWERLTDHVYGPEDGGLYSVTQTFGCDPVYVASFFPFSYGSMQAWIDGVGESEWAELSMLGSSEQGRDVPMLTITNTAVPEEAKRSVFILGRQHAAETAGSYQLTGLVDFLISGQVDAQPLLDDLVWRIVPMVNPDGVFLGHSRSTSLYRDPNADWANGESVEVTLVRSTLESLAAGPGVDMVLDWHNQMNQVRWYDFVYSPSGNSFFPVLSSWTDFDEETASGASSCTSADCSSRGWTMTHVLFDPVFVLEPCPHSNHWTVDGLREQGELTAQAIGAWFTDQP